MRKETQGFRGIDIPEVEETVRIATGNSTVKMADCDEDMSLVCGWCATFLVFKWYVKVTKTSKIENSGSQTGICENLVHMVYIGIKAI